MIVKLVSHQKISPPTSPDQKNQLIFSLIFFQVVDEFCRWKSVETHRFGCHTNRFTHRQKYKNRWVLILLSISKYMYFDAEQKVRSCWVLLGHLEVENNTTYISYDYFKRTLWYKFMFYFVFYHLTRFRNLLKHI